MRDSESGVIFLILYVDDIIDRNQHSFTLISKNLVVRKFFIKYMRETTYILGIKIYKDRSRRLFGFFQSTYIGKILKWFSMGESKKGYLPISQRICLSK
jgi:hypothetical protein